MSASPPDFRRTALREGSKTGKLPTPHGKKWGWWYWPLAAAALIGGSVWGVQHIEGQVEAIGPVAFEDAGIDPSDLEFKAHYRHLTVTGALPHNANPTQLEFVLANYKGPNGESMRSADVRAIDPSAKKHRANYTPKAIPHDIHVTAKIEENRIALFGSVASLSHAATLADATELNFPRQHINNRIVVNEQLASIENIDTYINNFASVLSNMTRDVSKAEITFSNDTLHGEIYTSNTASKSKIQAMIQDTAIKVLVSEKTIIKLPRLILPELTNSSAQVSSLQNEIALLQSELSAQLVFAPSSDVLPPTAFEVLEKVADAMKAHPNAHLEIGGHTDSLSSVTHNIILSEKRATAVSNRIVQSGIDIDRLASIGYGESHPITSNDTPENRAKNRRVEFRAYLND